MTQMQKVSITGLGSIARVRMPHLKRFRFILLLTGCALLAIAASAIANNSYQVPTLTQDWSNTGLITVNDDWAAVPGIVGYLGDSDPNQPTGIDPRVLIFDVAVAVDVIANQTNPNTLTNGGVAEFDGI